MTDIEHHTTSDIITDITFDEYWRVYAEQGYEWVGEGMVEMAAVHERHDSVTRYLDHLLNAYLALRPIGVLRGEQFAMRFEIDGMPKSRLPDIKIVLAQNSDRLTPTAIVGPADIVVEVVSQESVERDYIDKFDEYQTIRVQEYWLIDPRVERAEFNQLQANGQYQRGLIDADGNYQSPLLPGLVLHVPTLWQPQLPDIVEVVTMIKQQLGEV